MAEIYSGKFTATLLLCSGLDTLDDNKNYIFPMGSVVKAGSNFSFCCVAKETEIVLGFNDGINHFTRKNQTKELFHLKDMHARHVACLTSDDDNPPTLYHVIGKQKMLLFVGSPHIPVPRLKKASSTNKRGKQAGSDESSKNSTCFLSLAKLKNAHGSGTLLPDSRGKGLEFLLWNSCALPGQIMESWLTPVARYPCEVLTSLLANAFI